MAKHWTSHIEDVFGVFDFSFGYFKSQLVKYYKISQITFSHLVCIPIFTIKLQYKIFIITSFQNYLIKLDYGHNWPKSKKQKVSGTTWFSY